MELVRGTPLRAFVGDPQVPIEVQDQGRRSHRYAAVHVARAALRQGDRSRADQYAFGVTAAELLSGVHPERSGRRGQLAPIRGLPGELIALLQTMLAEEPSIRLPSMLSAAVALESAQRRLTGEASFSGVLRGPSSVRGGPGSTLATDQTKLDGTDINVEIEVDLDAFDATEPTGTDDMTTAVRAGPLDAAMASIAFGADFRGFVLGKGAYEIVLDASDALASTLFLKPLVPGHGVIVAGHVSTERRTAELRTYDYVAILYAQSFGARPAFDRAQYEGFIKRTQAVLKRISVVSYTLVSPPADLLKDMPRRGR